MVYAECYQPMDFGIIAPGDPIPRSIKVEIFYKNKIYLKHWFMNNYACVVRQKYLELYTENYYKKGEIEDPFEGIFEKED